MITNKKAKKDRLTSQRKLILDYLRSVKTHPSAEDIYHEVKKKLPRISLGTVYRNLEIFKEKGEIKEIISEVRKFNGDLSDHHHFICEKCHKIFDVNLNSHYYKKKKIKDIGIIKNYQVYFWGLCQKCLKRI